MDEVSSGKGEVKIILMSVVKATGRRYYREIRKIKGGRDWVRVGGVKHKKSNEVLAGPSGRELEL